MTGKLPPSATIRVPSGRPLSALAVFGLLVVLSSGCQNDEIQHYQVAKSDDARQGAVGGVKYTLPEGWRKARAKPPTLAAFLVTEGDKQGEVTISAFGGPAGGLLANVNRWRGQVGLPEIDEVQLEKDKDLKKITVDNTDAHFITIAGQKGESILGALVPRANQTWFFKMKGPADLIDKQKAAFDNFLASVQFDKG
jgi:hypothetical protein